MSQVCRPFPEGSQLELAVRHRVVFFLFSQGSSVRGCRGGWRVEGSSLVAVVGGDRDGVGHFLPPHSELRPTSPAPRPSTSWPSTSPVPQYQNNGSNAEFNLRISKIPTRPGYAPNATHPVTPHTPLEGFVSPLLEKMDATGPSSTYKFNNAQNLTGSTRNMCTGHGLLDGDAQTLDPRHEGGTGHNSRPPPPRPMQSSRSASRLRVSRGAGQPSHPGAGKVDLDLLSPAPILGPSNPPGSRYPTAVVNDPLSSHRPGSACQYNS